MNSLCSFCRTALRQYSTSASVYKWTASSRLGHKNRGKRSNFRNSEESDSKPEDNWNIKAPGSPAKSMRPRVGEFKDLPPSMRSKFKLFEDESEVVLDSAQLQWTEIQAKEDTPSVDQFEGLPLERGVTGVFDIHELVEVFRLENAEDLFVVKIPEELMYADYLVIVSGRSSRQLSSMAQFIAKYYKAKKHKKDPFLATSVSGWNSEWICLDFGNIVVHFMDKRLRKIYDIESLWALGPAHDAMCQTKPDATLELIQQNSRLVEQQGDERPVRTKGS